MRRLGAALVKHGYSHVLLLDVVPPPPDTPLADGCSFACADVCDCAGTQAVSPSSSLGFSSLRTMGGSRYRSDTPPSIPHARQSVHPTHPPIPTPRLAALTAHFAGATVVFHCASYGMSSTQQLQRRRVEAVNVGGTRAVVGAAVAAGVPRLVYLSTYNVVFGGQEVRGGDESLPYFPLHKHPDCYRCA